jgi:hypothetical protein
LRTRAASEATRGDVCLVFVFFIVMSFQAWSYLRKDTPTAQYPLDSFGMVPYDETKETNRYHLRKNITGRYR